MSSLITCTAPTVNAPAMGQSHAFSLCKDAVVLLQRNLRIIVFRIAPVTASGLQSMLSLKLCHGARCRISTPISEWVHDTHILGKEGQQQRSRGSERTSISCASYRKSPALGLMRTCTGIRRAACTALMSPALGKTSPYYKASVTGPAEVSKHVLGAVCHSTV